MSVINQMLRDLDQRGQSSEASAAGATLRPGTHTVQEPPRQLHRAANGHRRSLGTLMAAGFALGVAAMAAWYLGYVGRSGPPVPSSAMVPVPAAAAPLPSSENASAVAVAATVDAVAAEVPVSLRLDAQLERVPEPVPPPSPMGALKSRVAAVSARAESAIPMPRPAPATLAVVEKPLSGAPAAASTAAGASAMLDASQQIQRQNAAARDALAQAQSLWHAGNPNAATELLREAVQVALRTPPTSAPLDSTQLAMVRELVRMQMGTGHVAEAHALLLQNEARFGAVAELWALRANAAQRLALHQDSVQSYMQALQVRPNEQRWLLGMAVSLGAMGQAEAANAVVERARNEGAIPREIADYLRQLGVVVK